MVILNRNAPKVESEYFYNKDIDQSPTQMMIIFDGSGPKNPILYFQHILEQSDYCHQIQI